jgi:RNA polymerase subunit RPABC4/transcription elongation factor Spt4
MFNSKKCRYCGKDLKNDWVACPYCGEGTKKEAEFFGPFNIISDIEKEFERIDKMSDIFKMPRIYIKSPSKSSGISITIRSGTGMRPQVDVKTSGGYKKVEPELKRKLGVREGISSEIEEKMPERKAIIPKITEEPETKIERKGNYGTINIKLPDVKNEKDIEIRQLEQSIEIKAFAGDKAYFKLIPIKPNSQILNRSFKDGILRVEIAG